MAVWGKRESLTDHSHAEPFCLATHHSEVIAYSSGNVLQTPPIPFLLFERIETIRANRSYAAGRGRRATGRCSAGTRVAKFFAHSSSSTLLTTVRRPWHCCGQPHQCRRLRRPCPHCWMLSTCCKCLLLLLLLLQFTTNTAH